MGLDVLIGGTRFTLEDHDLLGEGGEARVYRLKDRAIKIYHSLPRAALKKRIVKLEQFPAGLPKNVLGPLSIVKAPNGAAIGFEMHALAGAHDFKRLSQPNWRDGRVPISRVLALFVGLHRTLRALHGRGVIVGDLNDSNIMFGASDEPWLIDADSMQFGGHLCVVAHERFLDPRLYGANLEQGAVFTPESDWYAFAVLLFSSLFLAHPYGGVDPGLPTLVRRAEAGRSILRPEVKRPKSMGQPEHAHDDLLACFREIFDGGLRGSFPGELLQIPWKLCPCGTEHARAVCPSCAIVTAKPLPARTHGRVRVATVHSTKGRLVLAVMESGLKLLALEGGSLRRENGCTVAEGIDLEPGTRFAISGRSTWIGAGRRLTQVRDDRVVASFDVDVFRGAPVFDASSAGCVRAHEGWLLDCGTGRRIGKVLPGQTWLRLGERFGYGFYRAGNVTVHFVFRPGQSGLQRIDLPPIVGRLLWADARFDRDQALLSFSTEIDGKTRCCLSLIDASGAVLGSRAGSPEDSPLLGAFAAKALRGGTILVPSDEGLVGATVDAPSKLIVERKVFKDTEPFVSATADILPGSGGSVFIINPREVIQISLDS